VHLGRLLPSAFEGLFASAVAAFHVDSRGYGVLADGGAVAVATLGNATANVTATVFATPAASASAILPLVPGCTLVHTADCRDDGRGCSPRDPFALRQQSLAGWRAFSFACEVSSTDGVVTATFLASNQGEKNPPLGWEGKSAAGRPAF
jgi:hypothetical protein